MNDPQIVPMSTTLGQPVASTPVERALQEQLVEARRALTEGYRAGVEAAAKALEVHGRNDAGTKITLACIRALTPADPPGGRQVTQYPTTPQEIADLMASEPDATFVRVRYKDDLLIALRDDAGEISAYRCRILDEVVRLGSAPTPAAALSQEAPGKCPECYGKGPYWRWEGQGYCDACAGKRKELIERLDRASGGKP